MDAGGVRDRAPSSGRHEYALAVDVGGTKAEAALVDRSGAVMASSRRRRATGPHTTTLELQATVIELGREALTCLGDDGVVVGVGVGSAGPLDLQARAVAPLNMPRAAGACFDGLEAVAGAPVALALDGTCIALAEHGFGAARGHRTVLAMVVSTGVGGGLVIDGRAVAGRSGNAGHVGQMRIERHECGTPHRGTVEDLASGPQTVKWAQERGWQGASGYDLARDYAAGDAVARAAVGRSAAAVGCAIASISTLLDLDVAVVAGGFAEVSPDYIGLVADAVKAQSLLSYAAGVTVVGSGLAGAGPLVGAAALAFARATPA